MSIYRLAFRQTSPQFVDESDGRGDAFPVDMEGVLLRAPRASLPFDIWKTQYGNVILSSKAAAILQAGGLTGFVFGRPLKTLVSGKPVEDRVPLLPRGLAGLASTGSGVKLTKYQADALVFSCPSDPPWGLTSDPYDVKTDLFVICPFVQTIFVSEGFVTATAELKGFDFLPFGQPQESAAGSGFVRQHAAGTITLRRPFAWLRPEERSSLWAQIGERAPGMLPSSMPPLWADAGIQATGVQQQKESAAPLAQSSEIRWAKRSLFENLPNRTKQEALEYAKREVGAADVEDWKLQDLQWDGDAEYGGGRLRRWTLPVSPQTAWVIFEMRAKSSRLFVKWLP